MLLLRFIDFVIEEHVKFINIIIFKVSFRKLNLGTHRVKGIWHQIHSAKIMKCIKPRFVMPDKETECANIYSAFDMLTSSISLDSAPEAIKKLPVNIHDVRPIGSWSKRTNIYDEKPISINGFCRGDMIDQSNNIYSGKY